MSVLLRRLSLLLMLVAATAFADGPVKVVYQFSEGLDQASNGLRNIKNHLAADPGAKIVAVALGAGVDFLLKGAKDKNGAEYADAVADLQLAGVEFRVCNNTLTRRNIDPNRLIGDLKIVPAGVAEVARLQAKEGFAYIKP
jgi:intracellular sulfur oxidation DsrE/DsrF family protein